MQLLRGSLGGLTCLSAVIQSREIYIFKANKQGRHITATRPLCMSLGSQLQGHYGANPTTELPMRRDTIALPVYQHVHNGHSPRRGIRVRQLDRQLLDHRAGPGKLQQRPVGLERSGQRLRFRRTGQHRFRQRRQRAVSRCPYHGWVCEAESDCSHLCRTGRMRGRIRRFRLIVRFAFRGLDSRHLLMRLSRCTDVDGAGEQVCP